MMRVVEGGGDNFFLGSAVKVESGDKSKVVIPAPAHHMRGKCGGDPCKHQWGRKTLFVGRVRNSFLDPRLRGEAARAVSPLAPKFLCR